MFVHLFITRCVLKVRLYDDWFMFVIIGAVAVAAIAFMTLYNTIVIRYILFITLCMLYLLTNREIIRGFLKRKIKK